ncbi:MAG: hypothetical protein SOV58_02500 [Candidatus Enteromonas sp.]|nr:hypothetical protein [Candidatus Enteromonas sp.]
MRRLIAYLALSSTLIVGTAALTSPLLMKMDTDLGYSDGKKIYFKASNYVEGSKLGNYEDFLTEDDLDGTTPVIERIADTMRSRLDTWGVSDYIVETQGYDTLAVSLRSIGNKSLEYTRIQSYLAFSGQHYELDASNTAGEAGSGESGSTAGYNHNVRWETMLDGKEAKFQLLDKDSYQVPVVIIPIDEEDKSAFLDLVKYCQDNTVAEETDEEGNVTTAGKDCNIVLWANREESDRYEDKADPNVASRIFFEHAASEDQVVYYASTDSDKEHPFLQLLPSSKATEGGTYNPTYAQEATDAANYLLRKFNASAYEYGGNRYRVNYTYSEPIKASVDPLISLGDFNANPSMGPTMISIVVGGVLLALLLAFFDKAFAAQEMAVAMTTAVGSLALFIAFGAQFNIGALLGVVAVVLVSLFQSLFYTSRIRNEVYKGRTLKKAQVEASKASVLPMVDAGMISIILGIFFYLLGGPSAVGAGVMLTVGGFVSIFSSLLLTRFMGWMLCNDSTIASHFEKALGIRRDRIPDLMKEEHQTYFGSFAEKNFTKKKKIAYIVAGLFLLAGIGSTIGFGVANEGEIFASASSESNTILRIEVKSHDHEIISVPRFASIAALNDENDETYEDVFSQFRIDEKPISSYVSSISLSASPKDVYETPDTGSSGTHYYYYYYTVELNTVLDLHPSKTYKIETYSANGYVDAGVNSLAGLAEEIADLGGEDIEGPYVTVKFASRDSGIANPYIGDICLGYGVGLAVLFAYFLLRYRPSRAIGTLLVACVSSFLALSFFVYTRIAVLPVLSLGLIIGCLPVLLGSLFLLNREKELQKEDREPDRGSYEKRTANLEKATSYEAGNLMVYSLLSLYLALAGFGFGPVAYCYPYLLAILLAVVGTALVLITLSPISARFGKWFSHIRFKAPKRKKKDTGGHLMKRKRGAEPEEAIFIGIND